MKTPKKGSQYWSCAAGVYAGKLYVDVDVWEVRSIKLQRSAWDRLAGLQPKAHTVFITRKTKHTHGSKGWARSISSGDRRKWMLGQRLPFGIFSTKLQALRDELKSYEELLQVVSCGEDLDEAQRCIRALKTRITKHKGK